MNAHLDPWTHQCTDHHGGHCGNPLSLYYRVYLLTSTFCIRTSNIIQIVPPVWYSIQYLYICVCMCALLDKCGGDTWKIPLHRSNLSGILVPLSQSRGVMREALIRGQSVLLWNGTLPLTNTAINTERNFNCCKIWGSPLLLQHIGYACLWVCVHARKKCMCLSVCLGLWFCLREGRGWG